MTTATHTLATTITATQRIAAAKADAADSRHMVNQLADTAVAPIDRITLLLAANFCATAARHLDEAYTIVSDYQTDNLEHIEKGGSA